MYIVELARKYEIPGVSTESKWFKALDTVLLCQREKINSVGSIERQTRVFRGFTLFYNSLVIDLFQEIVKHVPLERLIEKLQSDYSDMKLEDLKRSILRLLMSYQNERNMNSSLAKVISLDYKMLNEAFVQNKSSTSSVIGRFCYFCEKEVEPKVSLYWFKCGHLLCSKCKSLKFKDKNMAPVCLFCLSSDDIISTSPSLLPASLISMDSFLDFHCFPFPFIGLRWPNSFLGPSLLGTIHHFLFARDAFFSIFGILELVDYYWPNKWDSSKLKASLKELLDEMRVKVEKSKARIASEKLVQEFQESTAKRVEGAAPSSSNTKKTQSKAKAEEILESHEMEVQEFLQKKRKVLNSGLAF